MLKEIEQKIIEEVKNTSYFTSYDIKLDQEGKHLVDFAREFPLKVRPYHFVIDHRLTQNYHDYLEIVYFLEGSGTCLCGDKEYKIDKGDIFIFNDVELHTMYADKMMVFIAVYFLPELIYKPGDTPYNLDYLKPFYYRSELFNNKIPAGTDTTSKIYEALIELYRTFKDQDSFFRLASVTYLQEILLSLLYYYSKNKAIIDSTTDYDKNLQDIEKLKNTFILIMNNYRKNITLKEAAASAHMSPHYFCRFFKKVTGNTFKEYLLKIKIDKAKELLLKCNHSVTDIAYDVGFENLSYFCRTFKKFTKLNPMDFRMMVSSGR